MFINNTIFNITSRDTTVSSYFLLYIIKGRPNTSKYSPTWGWPQDKLLFDQGDWWDIRRVVAERHVAPGPLVSYPLIRRSSTRRHENAEPLRLVRAAPRANTRSVVVGRTRRVSRSLAPCHRPGVFVPEAPCSDRWPGGR
jgi:hypothetical protein